jgi:adenylosuccinate lyase
MKYDFSTFISPFTWRYGSEEMRYIFSEEYKYKTWRKIWVALAEAQYEAGLVSKEELEDLKKNEETISIEDILVLEKETKHDVFAAIKEYASKATIGGGKIHLGATSMDIVDNADMYRMKEALNITKNKTLKILDLLSEKIEKYAHTPCMAYTHLQPAEPTTLGYRFAFYAQDLLTALEFVDFVQKTIKAKGMKGAVGTSASYTHLLRDNKMSAEDLEKKVMEKLGLDAATVATQVYSRQYDYLVLSALNAVVSALAKFAGDLRIMQSPAYGEWSEPFGKKQVGSSAMPFKKNPINSEKICSLARYVLQLPTVALENASLSYLERTLDDSANKRLIVPEAFLSVDEILITSQKLLEGMIINEKRIEFNLEQYAPFAASEGILMECVQKGADRQEMHEILKNLAMEAWQKVMIGEANPIQTLFSHDPTILKYLSIEDIVRLLNVKHHIGDAPERALKIAKKIKAI